MNGRKNNVEPPRELPCHKGWMANCQPNGLVQPLGNKKMMRRAYWRCHIMKTPSKGIDKESTASVLTLHPLWYYLSRRGNRYSYNLNIKTWYKSQWARELFESIGWTRGTALRRDAAFESDYYKFTARLDKICFKDRNTMSSDVPLYCTARQSQMHLKTVMSFTH